MNNLYWEKSRKDITYEYTCNSEYWMSTEYDERVSGYWRLPNRKNISKLEQDEGEESETDLINTNLVHLGSFILSTIARIMNKFIRESDELKTNNVYHTVMYSLYIDKKHWNILDKAKLVGENISRCKNEYENGGIFMACF